METRTITHEVTFSVSPREVFEALMDSEKHSAFTGAPAQIERKAGGKFVLYGGHLTGTTIELKQDELIVQDWRGDNWPHGHYSRLTFTLTPLHEGRRTQLSLTQTGVPADHFEDINKGWQVYYWTKMATYLRDEKVAVVRRFMEEFKNKENLNIVDELFTPNFVLHLPGTVLPPGPEGQKAIGKTIFDAFSDVHVTVDDTIVEGDRVVERHTAQATRYCQKFYERLGQMNAADAWGKPAFAS